MKKYFIFSITLLAILIASCGKNKELGVNLLGNLKNENPYTGNEQLIFLDQNNDSIIFNGEGRYSEEYEYTTFNMNGYYVNEKDICSFVSSDGIYNLSISLYTHKATAAELTLKLFSNSNSSDGCNSYTNYTDIPLYENYYKTCFFIDLISITDKYYYDVFVDSSLVHYGECSTVNHAERLFYSTQYGILKIDFSNGTTWELESVSLGGK